MRLSNRKTFLVNSLSNNVVFVLRILVNLFITPVCLNLFGVDVFGAYLFSFGFVTSLAFLDFGISKGILRFTAEYQRDRNVEKYGQALSIAIVMNLSAALLAAVTMITLGANFDFFFNIDKRYVSTAGRLFYISSVYAFGYFLSQIPQAILYGSQRFKERNTIQILLLLLNALTIISLGYFKFSVEWFCILNSIIFLIGICFDLCLIWQLKLLQGVKPVLLSFHAGLRSDFVKYSASVFTLSAITMLSTQMDKVILSTVGSVSLVAIYSVVTKPYSLVKAVFTNSFVALEPIIVSKSNDLVQLRSLIVRGTRASLVLLVPMALLIIILFDPVIEMWTQKDIFAPYSFWGMASLAGLIIAFTYATVYRAIYLSGHINELIKIERVSSIINGMVSLGATFYVGVGGVILGTLVQSGISIVLVFRKSKEHLSLGINEVADGKFRLAFLTTMLVAAMLFVAERGLLSSYRGWFVLFKLGVYFGALIVPMGFYAWREKLLVSFCR